MTTRSARLGGPTAVNGTSDVVLFTCPAERVALVKGIRIAVGPVVGSGTGASVKVGIGGTADGQLVLRVTQAALTTYVDPDTDPIVLHEGETLVARQPSNSGMSICDVTISGAVLVQ